MTKIIITMDVDPEYADPEHSMGVTEEGYDLLSGLLEQYGTNIDVRLDPAEVVT